MYVASSDSMRLRRVSKTDPQSFAHTRDPACSGDRRREMGFFLPPLLSIESFQKADPSPGVKRKKRAGTKTLVVKGEVPAINDRNIILLCERRICIKNNYKKFQIRFWRGEGARRKFSESLGAGVSLAPRTRQRISLGSENDCKFRLRGCQSWKASSLGVVVPTSINKCASVYHIE